MDARHIAHLLRARLPARGDVAMLRLALSLRGAVALEPGGPSEIFSRRGALPVYPRLGALDTLDWAERTVWSAAASTTAAPIRRRLVGEAGNLHEIATGAYDAVLASHVLEHLANPLGALREWARVTRSGGTVLLVVPHRDGTFDRRRPPTELEHMRSDAEAETGEDDLSHLPEVLELHDLDMDPGAPGREQFERRCRENPTTRTMHHHVFVTATVAQLCAEAGLGVRLLRPLLPFHIVCACVVGARARGSTGLDVGRLLAASPFPSDRASLPLSVA